MRREDLEPRDLVDIALDDLMRDRKVLHINIDDAVEGNIATWAPHYIENLPARSHTITLSLIDGDGEPVAGPFNETSRVVRVADSCE